MDSAGLHVYAGTDPADCFLLRKLDGMFGGGPPIQELIKAIATALVDNPEDVQVKAVDGSQVTVLELRTHPSDSGKVIGRQGRTAMAIRTLLGAMGMKLHRRFMLVIVADAAASACTK